MSDIKHQIESAIFNNRKFIIGLFLFLTALMFFSATSLRIDAGFNKFLPIKHEYIQTYLEHQNEFGSANHVLIALKQKQGDIFTQEFFTALKDITDEVFFIPGIERSRVKSLFTPNVRFTEVVEDGIAGGNVIPNDFTPNEVQFNKVRNNILKSNYLGRLVSHDFTAALISAELQEINPKTGDRLDYIEVANELEEKIRQQFPSDQNSFSMHIIGFAKVMGDIANGAAQVVLFFIIAFLITALFVYLYTESVRYTAITLCCALVAVIWQLGLLTILGYGIDPMLILIPFLIFAIAVSHGVQMVSANRAELFTGNNAEEAARASFRRLLVPGSIALLSDTIGFISILLIEIQVIQEMAISASLGVAVIILTNLVLLPLLLSLAKSKPEDIEKLKQRAKRHKSFWIQIAKIIQKKNSSVFLISSLLITVPALYLANQVKIGDLHQGVPELRNTSTYNKDTAVITENFSIGVDVFTVIIKTRKEACVDYSIMKAIDDFSWYLRNLTGVQSVISLPMVAKKINAGWNEGHPKWHVLSRNSSVLAQSVAYVETSTGLLNSDCSIMPAMVFTEDHKAETIERLVNAVKDYRNQLNDDAIHLELATGNVGIMAARNEAVSSAQFSILFYVFAAIILLCMITFRSLIACFCIVLPLAWVSVLAYALMNLLEIGLKVSTLPVVALGVGIGVDYGIYIFSRFQEKLKKGINMEQAYAETLMISGNAVLFTGITLATAVATWIFSPLKFQADMGILLTFMFLVNMLAAMLLIPALAGILRK